VRRSRRQQLESSRSFAYFPLHFPLFSNAFYRFARLQGYGTIARLIEKPREVVKKLGLPYWLRTTLLGREASSSEMSLAARPRPFEDWDSMKAMSTEKDLEGRQQSL
jgi:hypothetical protein